MKKKESGIITVFLSVLLLAVLALILTTLEAVRLKGGYVQADRAFTTAIDSAFAGYYAPLYEEYHIFGLDTGFSSKEANYNTVSDTIKTYMEYTFLPRKGMDELPIILPSSFEPFGITIDKMNITSSETLMDKGGELFTGQACEYMKYKVAEDGIKNLLERLDFIDRTQKTGEILEKKQEAEETAAELEGKVLLFMEAIDGFEMKKHGVQTEGDMAKIKDSFVKKLWTKAVDRNSLGIDNDWLFQSVKNNYINPLTNIGEVKKQLMRLEGCKSKLEAAQKELVELLAVDTSKFTGKEKKSHIAKIEKVRQASESYIKEEQEIIESLNREGDYLIGLIKKEKESISKALNVLDEMQPLNEEVKKKAEKYIEALNQYREETKEEASNIPGDLDNPDISTEEGIQYDFDEIKKCLIESKTIIENYLAQSNLTITSSNDSKGYMSKLEMYENCINNLDFTPLKFNYTGCMKPKDSTSFFEGLNRILGKGLLELVIKDTDAVSENVISTAELPTVIMNTAIGTSERSKPAKKFSLDNKRDVYLPVFSFLNDRKVKENGSKLLASILYMEYIKEHFGDYLQGAKNGKRVLSYEKEYILSGEEKDVNNLKEIVNKIVLLRSLTDTITLLADAKSREEAQVMAAGFVGFTGMPAIIEAVKYIILVTWGFSEALVDTAAIFSGKGVQIIKQKKDFSLGLTDIFGLTKQKIIEKAGRLKGDTGEPGYGGYETYLDIFLLLENKEDKIYRSMDIIQENLRVGYEEEFSMKNCLAGFTAEGDFKMESRYIDFPFITKDKELVDGVYHYHIKKEYVY